MDIVVMRKLLHCGIGEFEQRRNIYMRYLTYEDNQIESEMIYCNKNGEETAVDIAMAIRA